MNGVYENLGMPFNGVTFERAVERALIKLLENFQGEGEPLEGVTIYPALVGVPKIFGSLAQDGSRTIQDAVDEASYLMLVGNAYEDVDGEEMCKVRLVVHTAYLTKDAVQLAVEHEKRVAALRGIFHATPLHELLPLVNAAQQEVELTGWEPVDGPDSEDYTGKAWVYERVYVVRGGLVNAGL